MLEKPFDPNKFIDRNAEQELFEELLQFKDSARILAIRAASGTGKSQLLQKFQYRCRTTGRPRIPVVLIDLGQLPDSSPLALAQQIVKELSAYRLRFPTFDRFEMARRTCDFSAIRGWVDLRNANLQGAQLTTAGIINQVSHTDVIMVTASMTTFPPDLQATAQDICVDAFLDDLKSNCQQSPIVILFDAYEKCEVRLRSWLYDYFLESHCFNLQLRPEKLIVVFAGREIPAFEQFWSEIDCKMIIKSERSFDTWSTAHVEEYLRVYGFHYTENDLKWFCEKIQNGVPLQVVVQTMEVFLSRQANEHR